ncbi:MAG: fluoride efflux transporter CrcB [Acidobacteriota bacterium]|nr:fluoride efflux transporter CrcB [Acidobacteriota bacterium]MDH3528155.1 fluoride efflux transporter CrcB [Acidobacteriota bacterium]
MKSLTNILFVAAGGALGAVARYAFSASPLNSVFDRFPFPTFLVNVIGSFLIGFCLILFADKLNVSDYIRLLIFVGFLGAFTTFSTYELEIWTLVKEGHYTISLLYLVSSVVVGFIGLVGGVWLGRQV